MNAEAALKIQSFAWFQRNQATAAYQKSRAVPLGQLPKNPAVRGRSPKRNAWCSRALAHGVSRHAGIHSPRQLLCFGPWVRQKTAMTSTGSGICNQ